MQLLHIIVVGIFCAVNIFLGLLVYFADRFNKVNKSFAILAFVIALWQFADFLTYQTSLANYQTLINRQ